MRLENLADRGRVFTGAWPALRLWARRSGEDRNSTDDHTERRRFSVPKKTKKDERKEKGKKEKREV